METDLRWSCVGAPVLVPGGTPPARTPSCRANPMLLCTNTRTRIVWSELHVLHSRVFYDLVCTGTSQQKGTDGAAARASTSRRRVRVPLRVPLPGQPLSRLRRCVIASEHARVAARWKRAHPSIPA